MLSSFWLALVPSGVAVVWALVPLVGRAAPLRAAALAVTDVTDAAAVTSTTDATVAGAASDAAGAVGAAHEN